MSAQLPSPDRVDWVDIWEGFGWDPSEAVSSAHLVGFAVEDQLDGNFDGEELVGEALEVGSLHRIEEEGIFIPGFEKSEKAPQESQEIEKSEQPEEMERSDLEQEVHELRLKQEEMRNLFEAMNSKINQLNRVLVGSDHLNNVVDPEQCTPVWTRLDVLADDVDDHSGKLQMFSTDSGSSRKPDERAIRIRQVLYEDAVGGSKDYSAMTRDQANTALGGGLSRAQVISAMRRAANGKDADVDGSCDLENLDGVEFRVGQGKAKQSVIRMDLENTTGTQLRKNLTTEDTAEGVS